MSSEQNKTVAQDFFDSLSVGNTSGALDLLADDATWTIVGKPEQFSSAGVYTKERLRRLFQFMYNQLKDGLTMTVKGMTAEGDRVAIEAESYGELTNGRVYNQTYHVFMEFREGKIQTVREYIDTQHAYAVWLEPVPTAEQS